MNSNIQPQLDALNDKLRELGRESVKSSLAKPQMALAVIRAAQEGILSTADAERVYSEYVAGRTYAISRNSMATGAEDNAKSIAANTSKVRKHIEAGRLPNIDFVEVADQLIDLRAQLKGGDADVKDVYQALYDAAVVQCKQPNEQLNSETLEPIILKAPKKDKTDIARMEEEYKRLYKLAHGTDDKPAIDAMMPVFDAIAQVFDDMGVDRPAMTKDEKKAADAIAFLRETGRIAA